jgi:hypothetical protein
MLITELWNERMMLPDRGQVYAADLKTRKLGLPHPPMLLGSIPRHHSQAASTLMNIHLNAAITGVVLGIVTDCSVRALRFTLNRGVNAHTATDVFTES